MARSAADDVAYWRSVAAALGGSFALYTAVTCIADSRREVDQKRNELSAELESSLRTGAELQRQLEQAERACQETQAALEGARRGRGEAIRTALQGSTARATTLVCWQRWQLWAAAKAQMRRGELAVAEARRQTEQESARSAELQRRVDALGSPGGWQGMKRSADECGVSRAFLQLMERLRDNSAEESEARAQVGAQEQSYFRGVVAVGLGERFGLPQLPRYATDALDSHFVNAVRGGIRLWEALQVRPGLPQPNAEGEQRVTREQAARAVRNVFEIYGRAEVEVDTEAVYLMAGRVAELGGWAKAQRGATDSGEARELRSGAWPAGARRKEAQAAPSVDMESFFISLRVALLAQLAQQAPLLHSPPLGSSFRERSVFARSPSVRSEQSSSAHAPPGALGSSARHSPRPRSNSPEGEILAAYRAGPGVVCHEQGALVTPGRELPQQLDGSSATKLRKGTRVQVKEVHGRRARISEPVYGWVSVRTTEGKVIVAAEESGGLPPPKLERSL